MENPFALLEDKVRKTAELVKRLRRENKTLGDELERARGRVQEAEQKASALERQAGAGAAKGREREAAEQELRALRQEREEVRRRIVALVEVLDGLE
jgi:predicted RNase H-like nuclease (RuvC/YqgF family)